MSYHEALKIFRERGDHPYIAYCLTNIGLVHQKDEFYHRAEHYHREAIFKDCKKLEQLGKTHFLNGNWNSAQYYYEITEEVQLAHDDTLSLFMLYNRLGELYLAKEDLVAALKYLTQGKYIDFDDSEQVAKNMDLLRYAHDQEKLARIDEDISNMKEVDVVLIYSISGLFILVIGYILRRKYKRVKEHDDGKRDDKKIESVKKIVKDLSDRLN